MSHFLAALGAAAGGDSRALIVFYLSFALPQNAEIRPPDSVIEIQAFLVTIVRRFDISHTDHNPQLKRARSGVMVPVVLGEEYTDPQLPLKIAAIRGA